MNETKQSSKPSVLPRFGTNDGLDVSRLFATLVREDGQSLLSRRGHAFARYASRGRNPRPIGIFVIAGVVTHVGDDFPETCDAPIALIEVSPDEGTATWPAGYSRVSASPADFDERLRFLPEPISPERPKGQVRNGSGLIYWLTRVMHSGA